MRLNSLCVFTAVLLVCLAAPARAQTPPAAPAKTSSQAAAPRLRERDTLEVVLQSRAGQGYRLMLSVPRGPAPAGGFPVFYVLDGDAWFGTAVEVARIREWGRLTPSIIAAIGYPSRAFFDPRRNFDFSPPGSADADFDPQELGGADAFLEFLTGVVKPWIAAHYAIDSGKQVLFGHSMGGLFVLHAMYTAPQSFNVYLAASPPIRFSNRLLVREASAFESNPARHSVWALISVGELESRGSPQQIDDYRRYFTEHPETRGGLSVEDALRQTFPPVEPGYDKARELRQLAARLARSGAEVVFVEFPGEEHTASGVDALNRGVPFALRPPPPPR